MDAVTYPHETVEQELSRHWLSAKFDVSQSTAVAPFFSVSAIPVAIAVTGDGRVLDRILGFVEPERFSETLERVRREQ